MNKKNALFLAVTATLATQAHAGGIILHEVATFDSVSSAGVGNTTNRKDASAAITNPAGLTAIEDSSWSFGLQVVDAKTVLEGKGPNSPATGLPLELSSEGTTTALAPSLAYAKRVTDNLVLGASLHADGGLGMEYDNGLSGYGFVDSQSQEFVNVNLAAGYAVNNQLSIGGALVIQHMMTTMDIDQSALESGLKASGEDGTTAASFMLSTMYDISDRTYVSVNYKHKVKHSDASLTLKGSVNHDNESEGFKGDADISVNWPSQLSFGIQHQLDHALTLKGMVGAEFWSDYSKELKTEDVYTIGTAIEYQHNAWTYQAGARYDTSFMKDKNLTPQLAVGDNWAVGFGAELKRSNGHRIGIAYQYRDMSTADTTHELFGAPIFDGSIKENRLHALSLSYAY
ncbi:OmpP1/FadL family transporter [Vibrio sp. WXL210]|uniref:OmpP1/FadL family transporter n=1 Tax=Vibrio sp. WXL210 TaxID=3450709 RepID=UPI003EC58B4B